jgi:hypothetical protein
MNSSDEFSRKSLIGKYRLEHRLQPLVLAFRGHPVHLQEALVRTALDLDQVRDRNRGLDLREFLAFAVDVLGKAVHAVKTLVSGLGRGSGLGTDERTRTAGARVGASRSGDPGPRIPQSGKRRRRRLT